MKRVICIVAALCSSAAAAQGPVVHEATGQATYAYPFELPTARGDYQPALGIAYSSGLRVNSGYGYGWSITDSYIEYVRRSGNTNINKTRSGTEMEYWLVLNGARTRLVLSAVAGTYRPELSDRYITVQQNVPSSGYWLATDERGVQYQFACVATGFCSRAVLREVKDPSGNRTLYNWLTWNSYQPNQAEMLSSISYNEHPIGSGTFHTEISLLHGISSAGSTYEAAARLYISQYRLDWVKVKSRGTSGLLAVRSYQMKYGKAPDTGMDALREIIEFGGDGQGTGALQGGTTRFGYGLAVGDTATTSQWSLGTAVTFTLPTGFTHPAWIDMDADGRPDLVEGSSWAPNKTVSGSTEVKFDPVKSVPTHSGKSITSQNPRGENRLSTDGTWPITNRMLDFDGDGWMDFVTINGSTATYNVRLGTSAGVVGTAKPLDVSKPLAYVQSVSSYNRVYVSETRDGGVYSDLVDLTGDGMADIVIVEPATSSTVPSQSRWHVFPGFKTTSGAYGFASDLPMAVAGAPYLSGDLPAKTTAGSLCFGGSSGRVRTQSGLLDMNGDGLQDRICIEGGAWNVGLNLGTQFASGFPWRYWDSGYPVEATPWLSTTGTYTDACGVRRYDTYNRYSVADINGDGLPEWLYYSGSGTTGGTAYVYWNTGKRFVKGPSVQLPTYPANHYQQSFSCEMWDSESESSYWLTTPARGADSAILDVNGDGVADLVWYDNNASRSVRLYPGSNAQDSGSVVVLRSVETPMGARYDLTYASGGEFGFTRGSTPYPVVRSVKTSGTAIDERELQYWYRNYVAVPGATYAFWPARLEGMGFQESWVLNKATNLVEHTRRNVTSHAFASRPVLVEVGSLDPENPGTTTTPPSFSTFQKTAFEYSAWKIGSGGTPTWVASTDGSTGMPSNPANTDYPVYIRESAATRTSLLDGVSFVSKTSLDLLQLDEFGTPRVTFSNADLSAPSDASVVKMVRSSYLTAPVCRTCPQIVNWKDSQDRVLLYKKYLYDAAGRLEGEESNGVRRSYNANGTVDTVTDGGVTTKYTYDAAALRPIHERTTSTAGKALVTERGYDELGRLVRVTGPYVEGAAGTPKSLHYVYDQLGRVRFVAASAASSTTINDALEAYVYLDSNVPRAVKAYQFAKKETVQWAGPFPEGNESRISITYHDALGRPIQTRTRLGTGALGGTDAEHGITQADSGYLVSGAVVFDAAGRTKVAFEPFRDSAETFVDYRTHAFPLDSGVRAVTTAFDAQSRPWCSLYQHVSGAVFVPASAAECADASGEIDYQVATALRYQAEQMRDSDGVYRWYTATVTRSKAVDVARALANASGWVRYRVDAVGNKVELTYDPLGRERTSTRSSAAGDLKLEFRTTYYQDGRVYEHFDGESLRTTTYSYELGRLKFAKTKVDGSGMRYRYEDLNRLTSVESVEYVYDPSTGLTSEVVSATTWHYYDTPYNADYQNTAGALAWSTNGEGAADASFKSFAVTRLGYDAFGRVAKRDTVVRGVTGLFTNTVANRDDGAVRQSTFALLNSGLSVDPAPVGQVATYDSAARLATVSASGITHYAAVAGTYDALGRPGQVKFDGDRGITTRTYSPFTGQLTADLKAVETTVFHAANMVRDRGRIKSYRDEVTGTDYHYDYDANARLFEAKATPSAAPMTQDYWENYFFDGAGRIHRVVDNNSANEYVYTYGAGGYPGKIGPPAGTIGPEVVFTEGDLGRVAAKSTGEHFKYDLEGHLTSIGTATTVSERLRYGPDGELIARIVGNQLKLYIGDNATVSALLPSGCTDLTETCAASPTSVRIDTHVLVNGVRVASIRPDRTLYYMRDERGSVVATTVRLPGGSRGGTAEYRYGPFGEIMSRIPDEQNEQAASELGFTGGLKLTGGLLHLRARVYDPSTRLFLQPDDVDANRYGYAGGDPANYTDPSGRMRVPVGALEMYLRTFAPELMPRGSFNLWAGEYGWDTHLSARFEEIERDRYFERYAAWVSSPAAFGMAATGHSKIRFVSGHDVVMPYEGGNGALVGDIYVYNPPKPADVTARFGWGASAGAFMGGMGRAIGEFGAALGVDQGMRWLAGRSPEWRRAAVKGVLITGVQLFLTATVLANPMTWGAVVTGAAAFALTNVVIGMWDASVHHEQYTGRAFVADAAAGAAAGAMTGLVSVSIAKTVGGYVSRGVSNTQAFWGVTMGFGVPTTAAAAVASP